jgi:hypothetical protein
VACKKGGTYLNPPHTSLSPHTCYVVSIRSKYSLRHPVLSVSFTKYKKRTILNLLKASGYYSYHHCQRSNIYTRCLHCLRVLCLDHTTLTELFCIIEVERVYCAVRAEFLCNRDYVCCCGLSHIQKPIRYLYTNIIVSCSHSEGYSGQNTHQMFIL